MSLPSRECGLKSLYNRIVSGNLLVTPLAGVWIEMGIICVRENIHVLSLPSRECGLKYIWAHESCVTNGVTPLAGVWIEIWLPSGPPRPVRCHSPRGSVDWNRLKAKYISRLALVTPLAEVWIEINKLLSIAVWAVIVRITTSWSQYWTSMGKLFERFWKKWPLTLVTAGRKPAVSEVFLLRDWIPARSGAMGLKGWLSFHEDMTKMYNGRLISLRVFFVHGG